MLIVTVGVLLSILVLATVTLRLDGRNRRVNHQLAVAMGPGSAPLTAPVLHRRDRSGLTFDLLRILLCYVPDAPANWPLPYAIIVGGTALTGSFFVAKLIVSLWLAVIVGIVVCCLVLRTFFDWQQNRYADKLMRQLPDTIELTVSAVRAGLPVAEAFRAVAREMPTPTREQFDQVVSETALGITVEEALRGIYQRSRVPEYAILSVTLAVQMKSGGRLAETLQILGDAIRERVALAGRAKALASESRLSARVMSSLPFLCGSFMYFVNPSSMDALFHDPRGRTMLGVAMVMLTIGVLSMRRMIKKGTAV